MTTGSALVSIFDAGYQVVFPDEILSMPGVGTQTRAQPVQGNPIP